MKTRSANRRRFITLMGYAAGAALVGCRSKPPSPEELAALLDLRDAEREWIASLSPEHVGQLHAGLMDPEGPAADRAVQLLAKILEPRPRLFAYAGYPPAPRFGRVCDGLIRE